MAACVKTSLIYSKHKNIRQYYNDKRLIQSNKNLLLLCCENVDVAKDVYMYIYILYLIFLSLPYHSFDIGWSQRSLVILNPNLGLFTRWCLKRCDIENTIPVDIKSDLNLWNPYVAYNISTNQWSKWFLLSVLLTHVRDREMGVVMPIQRYILVYVMEQSIHIPRGIGGISNNENDPSKWLSFAIPLSPSYTEISTPSCPKTYIIQKVWRSDLKRQWCKLCSHLNNIVYAPDYQHLYWMFAPVG